MSSDPSTLPPGKTIEMRIDYESCVTCVICSDLIQTAREHFQCGACSKNICASCLKRLDPAKYECPCCRKKDYFMRNDFIRSKIYPLLTTPCSNELCQQQVLDLPEHLQTCSFRNMRCPVCTNTLTVEKIHDHLAVCMDWRNCKTDSMKLVKSQEFYHRYDMGSALTRPRTAELKEPVSKKCKRTVNPVQRILYIWKKAGHGMVQFMCVDLGSVSVPTKLTLEFSCQADKDNIRRIGIPILHRDNLTSSQPVQVRQSSVWEFDTVTLLPGAHYFKPGKKYEIDVDQSGDWTAATLLEILENPKRGSFVTLDDRAIVLVINLDNPKVFQQIIPLRENSLQRQRNREFNTLGVNFHNLADFIVHRQQQHL